MSTISNKFYLLSSSCVLVALVFPSCTTQTDCSADAAWSQQLYKEVRVGNLPSVEALLSSKDCPGIVDSNGVTPLMIAAANGRHEVAKRLLEYGVEVDAKQKGGYTALMFASEACEPRLVSLLIGSGAYVPMQSYAGETSYNLAKQRADFWKQNSDNRSVLSIAQLWQLHERNGPPPKATCTEVSSLLEKHAAGG